MTRTVWCASALVLAATAARAEIDLDRLRPTTVAQCDALVRQHPADLDAYRCYSHVARGGGPRLKEAQTRLDLVLAREPQNHSARLYLGVIAADQRSERAEPLLRAASEGFAQAGHVKGEVLARTRLFFLLTEEGRGKEVEADIDRAEQLAGRSEDPLLRNHVLYFRGLQAFRQGNVARAKSIYEDVERRVVSDGPLYLQIYALNGLGNVAWLTGRLGDALKAFSRAADLNHRAGDTWEESINRLNVVAAAQRLTTQGLMTREEARRHMDAARTAVGVSGNIEAQAALHHLLASDTSLPLEERLREARVGHAAAMRGDNPRQIADSLRMLTRLDLQQGGPDIANSRVRADAAVQIARAIDRHALIVALLLRSDVARHVGDNAAALRDLLTAIDVVEQSRDIQANETERSGLFSQWVSLYYRAVHQLLAMKAPASGEGPAADAFGIAERLRARALLDALDAADASQQGVGTGPVHDERAGVLREIALTQRRLAHARGDDRRTLLERLDALEARERSLRDGLALQNPRFAALRRPTLQSASDVRNALGPDSALLSFQLSPVAQQPSSLFVITSQGLRTHRLPGRPVIDHKVAQFVGLIEAGHDERRAASQLYRELFGTALDELDPAVNRLVIVPDGALYRLPFDALRAAPEERPLAERFSITIAPSASVWLRLRRIPDGEQQGAIAFADPELSSQKTVAATREALWDGPLQLGRLAHARREARSLTRAAGRGSELLVGREASEARLKGARVSQYRVLHFAAHAVTDDAHPDRSAIVLAPGSDAEDGLLQIREIVELDLRGPMVILSGCRSASGSVLAGEGVMGLARAFLHAGARAVVGSLWPLRDDEAAALIEEFADNLGRGSSVDSALARARASLAGRGMPVSAWAGVVAIGDGGFTPFPGQPSRSPGPSTILIAAGVLLTVLLIVVAVRTLSTR